MNVERYLEQRRLRRQQEPKFRTLCETCRQPDFTCYCQHLRPFDPKIQFLILIHPLEKRRRVATGRMSHLTLKGSRLITGYDYTENAELNSYLDDPDNHCVVLYPGRQSINLTTLARHERESVFTAGKRPVVIVLDGTWSTAGKMLHRSSNVLRLPRICFTPPKPSNFRVRQQPKPECWSTLEALHHVIELTGHTQGFDTSARGHDGLLHVFDKMVEQQLEFIRTTHQWRRRSRHYRGRAVD